MIRIYGASDDLIEIEGDISDELNPHDDPCLLVCSDGHAFRVTYDGCWRFTPVARGTAKYTKDEAIDMDADRRPDGSSGYSDLVTLDGDVEWVALTVPTGLARRSKMEKIRI